MAGQTETHQPDEKIRFKQVGDVALDLHVFRPAPGGPEPPLPCIVFYFGGGWRSGSPSQFYPHCRYLAQRGMVAMGADYRVETRHGTSPFECVADGKSAIRWVRSHADDLGVRPDMLAAGGGSAGGHVAAACASVSGFDDPADDLSVSAVPDALVMFNPVFDNGPDGWGHDRVGDRWEAFSPLHNVSRPHPPAVVFFGSEDSLVPVATARDYQRRVAAAGSRCELYVYPGQPHAFFNYRDGSNPYYAATVHESDRFLASLGYLSGPPTIHPEAVEVHEMHPEDRP